MSKEYVGIEDCPFCKKECFIRIHDSEHERDSSNDSKRCLHCDGHYYGLTGKWYPGELPIISKVSDKQYDVYDPTRTYVFACIQSVSPGSWFMTGFNHMFKRPELDHISAFIYYLENPDASKP